MGPQNFSHSAMRARRQQGASVARPEVVEQKDGQQADFRTVHVVSVPKAIDVPGSSIASVSLVWMVHVSVWRESSGNIQEVQHWSVCRRTSTLSGVIVPLSVDAARRLRDFRKSNHPPPTPKTAGAALATELVNGPTQLGRNDCVPWGSTVCSIHFCDAVSPRPGRWVASNAVRNDAVPEASSCGCRCLSRKGTFQENVTILRKASDFFWREGRWKGLGRRFGLIVFDKPLHWLQPVLLVYIIRSYGCHE